MIYGVKSLRERLAAANLATATGTLKERIEALRKDSAYGASNSEQCEECSDDDESTSEQQSARPRERRTTHEERRKQLMADIKLVSALQPKHSCNCSFIDSTGARRECSWCLYGDGMFRDQLDKLSVGRGGFLMKTSSERREAARARPPSRGGGRIAFSVVNFGPGKSLPRRAAKRRGRALPHVATIVSLFLS